MAALEMTVCHETRLCAVNKELGYFHGWEFYSKPLEASPLVGGAPAGVFSKVFGIVELPDGVKRIDPTEIQFCDEKHDLLYKGPHVKTKDKKFIVNQILPDGMICIGPRAK